MILTTISKRKKIKKKKLVAYKKHKPIKNHGYEVYVLYCPFDKCIRYVGVTNNGLGFRMKTHISEARARVRNPSKKEQWIQWLIKNKYPLMGRVVMKCENKAIAVVEEYELMKRLENKRPLVNFIPKKMPRFRVSFAA